MSLADDELLLRRYIGEQMITPVMPAGARVIPAPVYFNDKEDYWATIESVSYQTRDEIELGHICFVCFYPVNYVDLEGPADSPLIGLIYEYYVFSQYDLERSDENISPDAFNKKMLAKHNEFIKLVLDLKAAHQGNRNTGVLDANTYAYARTTSLVQTERVTNKGVCEFVPDVRGHVARFQETVKLKLKAC